MYIILTFFLVLEFCLSAGTAQTDIHKTLLQKICCKYSDGRVGINNRLLCKESKGSEVQNILCLEATKQVCCKDSADSYEKIERQKCKNSQGIEVEQIKCDKSKEEICCKESNAHLLRVERQHCNEVLEMKIVNKNLCDTALMIVCCKGQKNRLEELESQSCIQSDGIEVKKEQCENAKKEVCCKYLELGENIFSKITAQSCSQFSGEIVDPSMCTI